MTTEQQIVAIVERQRQFFKTGRTRQYQTRIECLKKLQAGLINHEVELHAALKQDLGKPEFESYSAETGFCRHELTETLKQLGRWMKPRRERTSMLVQPATSSIQYSPLGVNLIIGPYNFPVMLTLSPLIAAIAAGNTAVVKTSEMTPACSAAIQKLIEAVGAPEYIACVTGAVEETTLLLAQKFDHIFFTGSPRVGSIIMSAAARDLTPVTLELGGKSPCIVHHDAKLDIAVKRICGGKFSNAGQICVAPDYVLVHEQVAQAFLDKLRQRIRECYGEDPAQSPDYGRIVNTGHVKRIAAMIDPDKVVIGGQVDVDRRYIAPTVLKDVTLEDKVMSEEIFGPVLPVLEYSTFDQIYRIIEQLPAHPLALYVFSESTAVQQELTGAIQFGGGCINNCIMHVVNTNLPFGGVGQSGMGAYHGFHGFERFSHRKSVLKSVTWLDLPLLYAPYRDKIRFLRLLMK
jgi:aldehyde dehydrogenase (NAD+)